MDLQDMTLKELWAELEAQVKDPGWHSPRMIRAELKRRCGIITEQCASCAMMRADEQLAAIIGKDVHVHYGTGPAPGRYLCPVLGKGDAGVALDMMLHPGPDCPKCGRLRRVYTGIRAEVPCPKCQASKPDAPKGYEFVGEWRRPEWAEYFLDANGQVVYMNSVAGLDLNIDGGKRWILRKVEAEGSPYDCPKCGRTAPWMTINTKAPCLCPECIQERPPAPAGCKYTEAWNRPKIDEYYLDKYGYSQICTHNKETDEKVDSGRRWILRKVEGVVCESELLHQALKLRELGRRLDNLERRSKSPPACPLL